MLLMIISYCDIKMNVIVKHGDIAIVGEIQFLLDFMFIMHC